MVLPDLDVFVGNMFIIDWEIFQLWLDGYECEGAVEVLLRRGALRGLVGGGASVDMLYSDVMDHFRSLSVLERLLEFPSQLLEQRVLQISRHDRTTAIERYYEFDSSVMRELIGKKPSSKYRKDLDDVGEKTGVMLRSCRRQFDNVRRIYKSIDETSGDVVANIKQQFLLPDRLARRYAVVLFMDWVRFETHKRKLSQLTFDDFFVCGDALLRHWADCQCELDREFLLELRDLKALHEREKDTRTVVLKKLGSLDLTTEARGDLQQNFRTLFRSLVNIAVGLNHNRELKDLFIDIQEKLVDPCRAARWTLSDMRTVLTALDLGTGDLETFRRDSTLQPLWQRFLRAASICIMQLFAS